ncbi:hypothetical protein [Schaalia hyovaginalis]|uniref:Uncharacterized protein n=1 Tax=Schaalia hyovaginalis TaxID=29316 RepID=A0A923E0D4_9ACTO|nr:hypothetical protein [Schaalia hyovaginalis]MBB6333579.1 hypothetical protein [Schaalia hyovaginalis]
MSTKKQPKPASVITINGQDYQLRLTIRATREIAARYGGLDHLGDKLMKSENFEQAIEEVIWLICLLANQDVAIWNLQHPDDKREELSTEVVELLTVPADLTGYKSAITAALEEGTRRAIVSEPDPKAAETPPAK